MSLVIEMKVENIQTAFAPFVLVFHSTLPVCTFSPLTLISTLNKPRCPIVTLMPGYT